MDDICIFSNDFNSHIDHLLIVFQRLIDANLKLNWSKCKFFQEKIIILGHVIEYNQIQMDKTKIEAIVNMLPPKNVKQLQKALGLFGYYRRYIKDYAQITKPLYELLQKNVVWEWSVNRDRAFQFLKDKLIQFLILRPPNFQAKFYRYTDA